MFNACSLSNAGRPVAPPHLSRQHGVDFYIGFIEQFVGATGSRPFWNSGIPTTRFILDQSGKAEVWSLLVQMRGQNCLISPILGQLLARVFALLFLALLQARSGELGVSLLLGPAVDHRFGT